MEDSLKISRALNETLFFNDINDVATVGQNPIPWGDFLAEGQPLP